MNRRIFPYKVIFSDLDLTLLHSDGKISAFGVQILNKALARGLKVCLVSARHPRGIEGFFAEFGRRLPYVGYNGALAVDEFGHTIHNYTIPTEEARCMLQIAEESGIPGVMMMYAQDRWMVEEGKINAFLQREIDYIGHAPEFVHLEKVLDEGIVPNKFLFASDPENSLKIERVFSSSSQGLHISRSSIWSVDIMPSGINKSVGVKAMLAYFGLSSEEAIAFGDSPNDIEMLKYVGLGVAMGNAAESVKESATAKTSSNDEDGVGHFLVDFMDFH
ncbi:MAG: HAD family hydrolase [Candidatus Bruticola sp.]